MTAFSFKTETITVSNEEAPFLLNHGFHAKVISKTIDSSCIWTDGYVWAENSFWNAKIDLDNKYVVILDSNGNKQISIPTEKIDWFRTSVEEEQAKDAGKICQNLMISSLVGTVLLAALIVYVAN
ncbi:MAG: hypothetical protein AABZ32_03150 [Bacteroidota bacterium]